MAKRAAAQDKQAGISSAAVQARTGHTWSEWFRVLDRAGADRLDHQGIAAHLHRELGVPGWWCQMITVAFEQARGRRVKHQRPDGYEISVSRTIAAPVSAVFAAWTDARRRQRWLPGERLTVRKATPEKSVRITWSDGRTSVVVDFHAKGADRCQCAVQHAKLSSPAAAGKMKMYWAEALERLKGVVAPAIRRGTTRR